MKKKIALYALMSIAGLGPTAAYAGCGTDRCSNMIISKIMPIADGDVFVELEGDMTSLDCSSAGDNRLTLVGSDEGSEKIYSLLLTKYMANESVTLFRIRTGTSGCEIYYVADDK